MNKKTVKYTDEPIEIGEIVPDFLPPPHELVFKPSTVKITISLSAESIAFFKKQAKRHRTQYQTMIRNLLDQYARQHG